MSGLTVGYTSIDYLQLEIKLKNGTEEEKRHANNILPIIQKKHLLLSTLLLSNAVAMESLPIFLDAIMPASLAILISTTFVLIFGEVVPQVDSPGHLHRTQPDPNRLGHGPDHPDAHVGALDRLLPHIPGARLLPRHPRGRLPVRQEGPQGADPAARDP